jgi:hypothetical protein
MIYRENINYQELQKTLDNILNDPFLDSSLDFYQSHKENELDLPKESEVFDAPEPSLSQKVDPSKKASQINPLILHKDLLANLQEEILKNTLATFNMNLALPYNHSVNLSFLFYEIGSIYHLIELNTFYNLMLFSKEQEEVFNGIQKIKKTIRAQIIYTYKQNPFLLKNLFITAPTPLWEHYLTLNDENWKENSPNKINEIKEYNSDLQKSIIKSYLDHNILKEPLYAD